jgi:hypothetical protein
VIDGLSISFPLFEQRNGNRQPVAEGNRQDISQGNMSPGFSGGKKLSFSCGTNPGQRRAVSERFLSIK